MFLTKVKQYKAHSLIKRQETATSESCDDPSNLKDCEYFWKRSNLFEDPWARKKVFYLHPLSMSTNSAFMNKLSPFLQPETKPFCKIFHWGLRIFQTWAFLEIIRPERSLSFEMKCSVTFPGYFKFFQKSLLIRTVNIKIATTHQKFVEVVIAEIQNIDNDVFQAGIMIMIRDNVRENKIIWTPMVSDLSLQKKWPEKRTFPRREFSVGWSELWASLALIVKHKTFLIKLVLAWKILRDFGRSIFGQILVFALIDLRRCRCIPLHLLTWSRSCKDSLICIFLFNFRWLKYASQFISGR